jgi:hypothetical protein
MNDCLDYRRYAVTSPDRACTLFRQTMGYPATSGFFARASYLGRHLSLGAAIVAYIAAFISMNFACGGPRR